MQRLQSLTKKLSSAEKGRGDHSVARMSHSPEESEIKLSDRVGFLRCRSARIVNQGTLKRQTAVSRLFPKCPHGSLQSPLGSVFDYTGSLRAAFRHLYNTYGYAEIQKHGQSSFLTRRPCIGGHGGWANRSDVILIGGLNLPIYSLQEKTSCEYAISSRKANCSH